MRLQLPSALRLSALPALVGFVALFALTSFTYSKPTDDEYISSPKDGDFIAFSNIKLTVNERVMTGNNAQVSAELGKTSKVGLLAQGDNVVSATFRFRRYTTGRSETKQGAIKAEIKYTVTVDGKTSTKTIERNWFAETSRMIEEKVTFSFASKKSFSNKTAVLTYSATLPE